MGERTVTSSEVIGGEGYLREYLGIIEDVLQSDSFADAQEEFFLKNCDRLDEEGNYVTAFQQYSLWVERIIESEVARRNFCLNSAHFGRLLRGKITQLQGEVFDTLYAMADFTHFQKTMFQYRRLKWPSVKDPKPFTVGPKRSASASNIPYERLTETTATSPRRDETPSPSPGMSRHSSLRNQQRNAPEQKTLKGLHYIERTVESVVNFRRMDDPDAEFSGDIHGSGNLDVDDTSEAEYKNYFLVPQIDFAFHSDPDTHVKYHHHFVHTSAKVGAALAVVFAVACLIVLGWVLIKSKLKGRHLERPE